MTDKELEQIYNEGYKVVYWTAMSFLKNEEDAEDIVQDVFVTLIKSYDSIRDKDKVIPWLKKTAANRCLDKIKLNKTDNAEDEFFDSIEALPEDFLPDSIVESDEARAIIVDIINNSLSEDVRMTLVMFYFDEMSTKEIAEALGIPAGTVSWRISFAKKTIKKEVEKYEEKNKTKLFGMGLPFLTRLFMKEAEQVHFRPMPSSLIQTLTNPSASTGLPAKEAAKTIKTAATKAAKEGTGFMLKKMMIGGAAVLLAGSAAVVTVNKLKKDEPQVQPKTTVETTVEKSEKTEKKEEGKIYPKPTGKKSSGVKTLEPGAENITPKPTPTIPPMQLDGQMAQALYDIMMDLICYGKMPDHLTSVYHREEVAKDEWAFFDVDQDGKNELIIYEHTNTGYKYGIGSIYDYDPQTGEWTPEVTEFFLSADNHFYDNGVIISTAEPSIVNPIDDSLVPFTEESVFIYDPAIDNYNTCPNHAERWTKEMFRKLNPDEEMPPELAAHDDSDYLYRISVLGKGISIEFRGKEAKDEAFNPHIEGASELHPEFFPATESAVIEYVQNMHY